MKKWSKKRILSLCLALTFMVGIMLNFPINANASPYPGANISLGSSYSGPINVVLDNSGDNIYVSEYNGGKIIKMDKDGGNSTTIASELSQPIGMVFDSNDDLYVALHSGHKVIKIDHNTGATSDVAATSGFCTGIVLDSSKQHLYVADYSNGKIIKMDKNGTNQSDFVTGLGSATIIGMAIDSNNNLYVSDRNSNSIKKISTSGTVTTFATGLSSISWVTVDSYGYVYASATGSRLIKKLNMDGNLLASFSTGSYGPWGSTVDSSGYIYFVDMSTNLIKIVGNGNTVGTTQIVLEMNNELVGSEADPAAFTLHGIASNPTITSTEVSGKNITLNLSSNISGTDTNIKVDYTKSGTNDLTANMTTGSSVQAELDNFTGLPVKNNIVSVASVTAVSDKNVEYGTTQEELSLPTNVNVRLSNSVTTSAAVTWDNGNPVYNGNNPGSYSFSGTLTLPSNIINTLNLKASVNVIVGDSNIPPVTTSASVRIIGTPRVGNTLSTQILDEIGNEVTTTAGATYKWYRLPDQASSIETLVGTDETYILVSNDVNQYIKVYANYEGDILEDITSIITNRASSGSSKKSKAVKAVTGTGVSAVATSDESTLASVLNQANGYTIKLTNSWGDKTLGGTVSNIVDKNGTYAGSIITANESGLAKLPIEYNDSKNLKYIYKYDPTTKLFIIIQSTVNINGKNIELSVNQGETYYITKAEMTANTVLNEGWNTINNLTYRVEGASLKSGWILDNNIWYYLDETSKAKVENNWVLSNNNWYCLNEKGEMISGWKESNGGWYYLNSNGDMAKGWKYINNNWYYLNANGTMAKNTSIDNYSVDENGAWIN